MNTAREAWLDESVRTEIGLYQVAIVVAEPAVGLATASDMDADNSTGRAVHWHVEDDKTRSELVLRLGLAPVQLVQLRCWFSGSRRQESARRRLLSRLPLVLPSGTSALTLDARQTAQDASDRRVLASVRLGQVCHYTHARSREVRPLLLPDIACGAASADAATGTTYSSALSGILTIAEEHEL